ncbi:response regulator transcription factor [Dyadobacter fermentans]|uniref:Two component transcriptional regulator, LuxR family n=1 Tax=Dyadobacter fermentans (strain ATCC 700827 / DSM 18053 / CIP 107007 / KCTC 52180 / NS114) TaxID=471854 RepID=C6VYQ8_DYAFD|nr:response regulator transcription factor [Dyadobacter fermentans]ACT93413.1 two component transcriptional regulator, LuxR family [Dyadobacter fermentans DSM 18053]
MKTESALKVLIFDLHPVSRKGIRLMLDMTDLPIKVTEASRLRQFYKYATGQHFDLVILSVNEPDSFDTSIISGILPKTVVLYTEEGAETAMDLMALGAGACMSKKCCDTSLKEGIFAVLQQRQHVCDITQAHVNSEYWRFRAIRNGAHLSYRPRVRELTGRENEVAALLETGMKTGEIASRLQIQASTVSTLKARAFRKLSVTNLTQAIQALD